MIGVKSISALEKGDLLVATAAGSYRNTPSLVGQPIGFNAGQTLGAVTNPALATNGQTWVVFTGGFGVLYLLKTDVGRTVQSQINPKYTYPDVGSSATGKKWWQTLLETATSVFVATRTGGTTPPYVPDQYGQYDPNGQYNSDNRYQTQDQQREETEAEAKRKQTQLYVIVGVVVVVIGGLVTWLLLRKKKPKAITQPAA